MLATVTWYVNRASGMVAYLLLAGSVIFGLLMAGRLHESRPTRPWMLDVHRMLGGLAVLFTGVHVVALLLDSFVAFDVVDVLVPFASGWNPAAVAAGVVAMWLLATVEVTSLLRRRLPNRVWRRVHVLSFAVFVLASAHFVAAGTDISSPVVAVLVLAVSAAVVALTAVRIGHRVLGTGGPASPSSRARSPRTPAPAASCPRPVATRRIASTPGGRTPPPPPPRCRGATGSLPAR